MEWDGVNEFWFLALTKLRIVLHFCWCWPSTYFRYGVHFIFCHYIIHLIGPNVFLFFCNNSKNTCLNYCPVDTGRKLNVHKTSRRRPGRLLSVICTFNSRSVSTGEDCQGLNFHQSQIGFDKTWKTHHQKDLYYVLYHMA